jgi:hypothetical protein
MDAKIVVEAQETPGKKKKGNNSRRERERETGRNTLDVPYTLSMPILCLT